MGTTFPILHRAQRRGAGDECAHGVFPAKLAEAGNSLLPKVILSSVLALGCGTGWDGHSPVWNKLVWGWEWEWEAEGLEDTGG